MAFFFQPKKRLPLRKPLVIDKFLLLMNMQENTNFNLTFLFKIFIIRLKRFNIDLCVKVEGMRVCFELKCAGLWQAAIHHK